MTRKLKSNQMTASKTSSSEIEQNFFSISPKLPHTARIEKIYFSKALKTKPKSL